MSAATRRCPSPLFSSLALTPVPWSSGSYFVLSMFDKLWHPDVTEAEALDMHLKGIEEVKQRLVSQQQVLQDWHGAR